MTNQLTNLIITVLLCCYHGYRNGPPLEACGDMFPEGHGVQAQTNQTPFTFTVNATQYRPGDVIKVVFNSSGDWFMEGALIQMRTLECKGSSPAVGRFSVEQNEDFLQTFDCFSKHASALRHFEHLKIYNRTFYWTAPSEAVGHVYIKATIARNQQLFWTNVTSPLIYDASDSSRAGIMIKDLTCGAERSTYVVLTIGINILLAFMFRCIW